MNFAYEKFWKLFWFKYFKDIKKISVIFLYFFSQDSHEFYLNRDL